MAFNMSSRAFWNFFIAQLALSYEQMKTKRADNRIVAVSALVLPIFYATASLRSWPWPAVLSGCGIGSIRHDTLEIMIADDLEVSVLSN